MSPRPLTPCVRAVAILTAMTVVAACEPVESGSPNMAGVQAHLGFDVGMVPEGCEPLGLSGDGRGTMVGATFECDLGTILIERFDSSIREDDVPAIPAESGSSEIEWRDGATRDVIRLRSDGVPIEVLFDIADSIHILDD